MSKAAESGRAAPHSNPTSGPLGEQACHKDSEEVILSFDVEEHHRIEAAAGLDIDPSLRTRYGDRAVVVTRWILELLERSRSKATFFVVGQFAQANPGLVRDINHAGHEVASHGWDHRRILDMDRSSFREDVHRCKEVLEQITGEAVVGYRAPTFSVVRKTAWAIDVLAEIGYLYDSSIYPVRHDRYGVPGAPRTPFVARGERLTILELPPATLRIVGINVPAGGGGYFRLLPLEVMEHALRQLHRGEPPEAAMIYFHPWEFDPDQPRLPLRRISRFRTYVGVKKSRRRLATLMGRHRFSRAIDVVRQLENRCQALPRFRLGGPG